MRVLLGLMVALALSAAAAAEERVALLIGNEAYPAAVGRLNNPHDDVDRIAAALRQAGFHAADVRVVKDAGRDATLAAVRTFRDRLAAAGSDAVGFFYYSGHGGSFERRGYRENFLIPAGADITLASDLPLYGVSLSDVIDTLSATPAKAVFVVSDACRNSLPFSRGGGDADKGFTPEPARPGLFIAHATAEGSTAPDDGLFARALAARLPEEGTFAPRAFELAFRDIASKRAAYRLPTVSNALVDDFCFVSCPDASVIPASTNPYPAAELSQRSQFIPLQVTEFSSIEEGLSQNLMFFENDRADRLGNQVCSVTWKSNSPTYFMSKIVHEQEENPFITYDIEIWDPSKDEFLSYLFLFKPNLSTDNWAFRIVDDTSEFDDLIQIEGDIEDDTEDCSTRALYLYSMCIKLTDIDFEIVRYLSEERGIRLEISETDTSVAVGEDLLLDNSQYAELSRERVESIEYEVASFDELFENINAAGGRLDVNEEAFGHTYRATYTNNNSSEDIVFDLKNSEPSEDLVIVSGVRRGARNFATGRSITTWYPTEDGSFDKIRVDYEPVVSNVAQWQPQRDLSEFSISVSSIDLAKALNVLDQCDRQSRIGRDVAWVRFQ